jgi:hypothetical protein
MSMRAGVHVAAVIGLAGCGRIGFEEVRGDGQSTRDGDNDNDNDSVTGVQPIHEYLLSGDFNDV